MSFIRFLFRNVRPFTEILPFGKYVNFLVIEKLLHEIEFEDGWIMFRDHIMGMFPHCDFAMFSPSKRTIYITTHAGINGITAISNLLRGKDISDLWDAKHAATLSTAIRIFDSQIRNEYSTITKFYIVESEEYIENRKNFYKTVSLVYGRATTIQSVLDDDTLLFSTSIKGQKPDKGYLNRELSKLIHLAIEAGDGKDIDEKYKSIIPSLVPYLGIITTEKVGVLISDLSVATDYIKEKSGIEPGNWVFFPSFPPFSTLPSVGLSRFVRKGKDVVGIGVRYPNRVDNRMYKIINSIFRVLEII